MDRYTDLASRQGTASLCVQNQFKLVQWFWAGRRQSWKGGWLGSATLHEKHQVVEAIM